MTWPSVDAPATAPSDHGEVRTQAYYAGGGDQYLVGKYALGLPHANVMAAGGMNLNELQARPFYLSVRRSFDRIGIYVTTGGASSLVRLGIYSHGSAGPGSRILDAGPISGATGGAKEITISQSLDPGLYWLVAVCQTATCSLAKIALCAEGAFTATTPPGNAGYDQTIIRSGVSGALPTSFAPDGTSSLPYPAVCLRAA